MSNNEANQASANELVRSCKKDYKLIPEAVKIAHSELNRFGESATVAAFAHAGYADMALFSQFFFSHWIRDGVPPHHQDFYDLYKSGYGNKRINVIYPRGFGKTAVCVKITALHGLAYFNLNGWMSRDLQRMTGQPLTVLASQSTKHSVNILTAIKFELEFNDLFVHAFAPPGIGALRYKENKSYFVWNQEEIVAANSAKIVALGRGSQVRGINHLFFRPTLFIGDDLEGERNTTNINIINDTNEWFFNAVEPSLTEENDFEATMITVGTVVHEHCLVNTIRKKEESFKTLYKKAIYSHRNGKRYSLWPLRKPIEMLQKKWDKAIKAGRESGFLQEFQNEPMSRAERPFNSDTFKTWTGQYLYEPDLKVSYLDINTIRFADGSVDQMEGVTPINVYIGVDPSSRETGSADFTVIMVIGVDFKNNVYAIEYTRERTSIPTVTIDKIYHLATKYHAKSVCIETIGFQHTLYAQVRQQRATRDKWFRLFDEQHREQMAKAERLEMMEPRFSSGTVHLREGMTEFREELVEFPQSSHDDCMDGFWLALRESRRCPYSDMPFDNYRHDENRQPDEFFDPLTV